MSQEFEGAVASGGPTRSWVSAATSGARARRSLWLRRGAFSRILFEDDIGRRRLLKHLEFGDALVAKETAALRSHRSRRRRRRGEGRRRGGSGGGGGGRRRRASPLPPVDGESSSTTSPRSRRRLRASLRPWTTSMDFFNEMDANGGSPDPLRASRPSSSRPISEAPEVIARA